MSRTVLIAVLAAGDDFSSLSFDWVCLYLVLGVPIGFFAAVSFLLAGSVAVSVLGSVGGTILRLLGEAP